MDKTILRKWLKAGFIDKESFHPTSEGVPQGSPISPVLTNMTLDGLEKLLSEHFKKRSVKGKTFNPKVNMVRYADDFIVTGVSKQLLEQEVKPLIEEFLKKRGLRLSQTKTKVTHISDGFDFLGQNLRKYKGTLITKPSKANVASFLDKVRRLIRLHRQSTQADLIKTLNPVIRGWANYHRHVCSKQTYSTIDHII
jgi:RNA-directed DNA polymerase